METRHLPLRRKTSHIRPSDLLYHEMDSALDLEHSDQASHFTAFSYSTLCLQYHLLTLFRIDCSTTRLRVLTSHKGLWKLMPSDGFDVVDGGRRRSGLEEEDGRSRSMLLLIRSGESKSQRN
ncbi:hypothetical protein BT69DRAFT_564679 [Atractiella rhizophila]|nr:hypothetical protein BT69DRAFT_564679 [Atractiella rhizophila]